MEKKFGVVEVNGVTIYNTTPHPIRIISSKTGEVLLEIPKATEPLRIQEVADFCGQVGGIPLFRKSFSGMNLPPVQEDTFYLVALPVAQMFRRKDFIVPHDYVRDSEGNVIGCRAFAFID
jgi:hypothetical protein